MAGYRKDRVAEDVRRELTAIIGELKDPRVQGKVTVARVDLNPDATSAKVYVSSMEGIDAAKLAVEGLGKASGHIKREIGSRLRIKFAPELKFIADDSVEYGIGISKIIDELNEKKSKSESDDETQASDEEGQAAQE
ncbi:MAG: 30S ribosome-binding factor RbfA [Clostridiales bacterium]|nr:30S ribosome-binding factor RbfA [Clostridiales bacterium]